MQLINQFTQFSNNFECKWYLLLSPLESSAVLRMRVHTSIHSLKEWGEDKDRQGSGPVSFHQNSTPLRSDLSQQRRSHSTNSFSGSSFKLKWDKVSHTFFYTCDRNSKMHSLKTAENDTGVPLTEQRMSKQGENCNAKGKKSSKDWDFMSFKIWL